MHPVLSALDPAPPSKENPHLTNRAEASRNSLWSEAGAWHRNTARHATSSLSEATLLFVVNLARWLLHGQPSRQPEAKSAA